MVSQVCRNRISLPKHLSRNSLSFHTARHNSRVVLRVASALSLRLCHSVALHHLSFLLNHRDKVASALLRACLSGQASVHLR